MGDIFRNAHFKEYFYKRLVEPINRVLYAETGAKTRKLGPEKAEIDQKRVELSRKRANLGIFNYFEARKFFQKKFNTSLESE